MLLRNLILGKAPGFYEKVGGHRRTKVLEQQARHVGKINIAKSLYSTKSKPQIEEIVMHLKETNKKL